MDWRNLYSILSQEFTAGDWWPGETAFEVMVGAVLTQNTTWTSVEKAIKQMKSAKILSPQEIASCPSETIIELIKPAGSYTRKAQTLYHLTNWLQENQKIYPEIGNKTLASTLNTADLRASLLSIPGVGPETADDILLYVYLRPVFIFDAYARRILEALGQPVSKTYEGTRKLHQASIEKANLDASEHGHFHGLIVTAGKYARRHGWNMVTDIITKNIAKKIS